MTPDDAPLTAELLTAFGMPPDHRGECTRIGPDAELELFPLPDRSAWRVEATGLRPAWCRVVGYARTAGDLRRLLRPVGIELREGG